jgi:hypothetical protein
MNCRQTILEMAGDLNKQLDQMLERLLLLVLIVMMMMMMMVIYLILWNNTT